MGKTGGRTEQSNHGQLGDPVYTELAEAAVQHMKQQLLTQSVIHADETVVQVLKEGNKPATSESRMWI